MLSDPIKQESFMNWSMKSWSELTTDELYELLALRAEVFVVEQTCPFQDLDGLDRRDGVLHLLGREGDHLAAYARIMAPGIGDDSGAAIGRVVTSPTSRGADWVTACWRKRSESARHAGLHTASGSVHRPTCKVFTASMVSWPKGKGIWKMTSLTWGCEGSLPDIVRRQERGK